MQFLKREQTRPEVGPGGDLAWTSRQDNTTGKFVNCIPYNWFPGFVDQLASAEQKAKDGEMGEGD